jgi:hypothetical protein
MMPSDPWTVSSLPEGEPTTFTGGITSGLDAFEIVNIESSAEWLTVEPRPMDDAELEEAGDGLSSGYVLATTIHPEMTVGRFHEKITIETDLEEGHRVEVTVVGTRPGPFSILGRAWFGGEMTVRMDEVPSAEGKSVTLSMFTAPGEEPLELTSVTSDPDIAKVTLERDKKFPGEFKEKYDITFSLPPGTPVGRYADDDRIDVRLNTNRDEMAEINLSIDAIIE